jgi:hypothetical protein
MKPTYLFSVAIGLAALLAGPMHVAAAADAGELRRLQQQRDQHHMELRLKMQQQQNRALQSGPPAIEVQRWQRELAAQQRQRELHERQAREAVVPALPVDPAVDQARRDIEAQRARRERIELIQPRE